MKIGMLFPGYGSQFVGMGKDLYDNSRIVQEYFEEASTCLSMNFVKLCFASSDIELSKMGNAFPALFLVSSAIAAVLKQENIIPTIAAGYNTGEYSALHCNGGVSLPDGLYLLSKYAAFYQEFLSTAQVAMIHVRGISVRQVFDLCTAMNSEDERGLHVAIFNGNHDCIVGGPTQAVTELHAQLAREEVSVKKTAIELGLHSIMMQIVAQQFGIYLEKVDFKDMQIPLLNSTDGKIIHSASKIKKYIVERIYEPIMWTRVMSKIQDYSMLIEIGPGTTLSALMHHYNPQVKICAINTLKDIEELKQTIAQLQKAETEKAA